MSHSTAFSEIMSATRNIQLDGLVLGRGEQRSGVSKDGAVKTLGKSVRLRFGVLLNEDEEGEVRRHVGFGIDGEVGRLNGRGRFV